METTTAIEAAPSYPPIPVPVAVCPQCGSAGSRTMRFMLHKQDVIVCEECSPDKVEIPVKVQGRTGAGQRVTIAEIKFSGDLDWSMQHPLVAWHKNLPDDPVSMPEGRKPWYSRATAWISAFFREKVQFWRRVA